MKNSVLKYSLLVAAMFAFGGCLYEQPTAPTNPMPEPTQLTKQNITLKHQKDEITLKNGVIHFKNGKRLADEEAKILDAFYAKDQMFYIIQFRDKFKIKNSEKETIWEIQSGYFSYSKYQDDFIFVVKARGGGGDVYSFNGTKVTLIDRGLDIPNGRLYGIYALDIVSRKRSELVSFGGPEARAITDITITNILDGSKITFKDFHKFLNSECIECTKILGIAGDNLILTYDEGYQKALASFNLQTRKGDILHLETPNDKSILQVLQNEEEVVVRIFDYEVGEIVEIDGRREYDVSQAPKRIIHLNTLTEVDGLSKGFGYIPLKTGYQGMGGYITQKYITYKLYRIMQIGEDRPMF
ncbi:MAG: hypothetical protein ACTTH5_07415 [Wolinella sp.]